MSAEGTPTPGDTSPASAPVDAPQPSRVQVIFKGTEGGELTRFTMTPERAELARSAWETARAAAHTGRIQTDAAGPLLPGMCPLSLCSLRAGGYSVWLPDVALFIVQGVKPPPMPSGEWEGRSALRTSFGAPVLPPVSRELLKPPPQPQNEPRRHIVGERPPQPQESPDRRAENGQRYPTSWAEKAAAREARERAGEGTWAKFLRWLSA